MRSQQSEISKKSELRVKIVQIESAKDLDVYKLANEFAMELFEITKKFPA